jgi:nitroreductase
LFEAARWAPSEYNLQPWHFVYAKRGTKSFEAFLDLLVDFNKMWADKAGALVVVVSRHTFDDGQKSRTHAFDTGAAWQNLALQASMNGLVAHGMGGFDYDKAKKALNIPDDYQVQAMIAIGKPGKKEDLPTRMQEVEKPSTRKKVEEFAFEGTFGK